MQPDDASTPPRPSPEAGALEGKALANAKREQRNRRTKRIRRTVATSTAGLFVAAFLGISVQLASGHDPALLASAAKRSAVLTANSSSAAKAKAEGESGSSGESESSSGEESSSSSSESEESSPSSVTTSQS